MAQKPPMPGSPVQVWIALGGNLGDVPALMQHALRMLDARPDCAVTAVSPLYSTPPWGITEQPDFINACAGLETTMAPPSLLSVLKDLEAQAGRTQTVRNGPRPLDIDILLYGQERYHDEALTIPHPRMLERAFVLVPLADIAADVVVESKSIAARAAECDRAGMRQLGERLAALPKT